jgi:hypothetical protein
MVASLNTSMSYRVFRDEGRAGHTWIDSWQERQFYYWSLSPERSMANAASYLMGTGTSCHRGKGGQNVNLTNAESLQCRRHVVQDRHSGIRIFSGPGWKSSDTHNTLVTHCTHASNERIVRRLFSIKFDIAVVNPLQPLNNVDVLFCSLPTDTQSSSKETVFD